MVNKLYKNLKNKDNEKDEKNAWREFFRFKKHERYFMPTL